MPVTVTIRDNDRPGLTVSPASMEIPKGTTPDVYTVALNTKTGGKRDSGVTVSH